MENPGKVFRLHKFFIYAGAWSLYWPVSNQFLKKTQTPMTLITMGVILQKGGVYMAC